MYGNNVHRAAQLNKSMAVKPFFFKIKINHMLFYRFKILLLLSFQDSYNAHINEKQFLLEKRN